MGALPDPSELQRLGSLSLDQFWWVLTTPAPLAGMRMPDGSTDFAAIAEHSFKWLVALTESGRPACEPLQRSQFYLEDLVGGYSPSDPEGERKKVEEAASFVVGKLRAGEGVVVHCWGGTGRTGTVVGRALVLLGHDPAEVVRWLDIVHRQRGREGWPESDWQAEVVRT